ncbi:MAG: tetratricopeptide repeat protein [Anaerolineae bacterium]|nr:tetratricopeptide repeat protein [Gemmatimonadaceae bacterium]
MRRSTMFFVALTLATLPRISHAQEHKHDKDELGTVTFPVSCNAEAQRRMNTAVAMLHSFWFPEARKKFESVVEADPGCGIAHWGVALTHFGNPVAGGSTAQGQAAGWESAQKAVSTGARNERDREYINAAATLFRDHDKVDNRTRLLAYQKALKTIVDKFPADTEARIFHAVTMVANAPPTDLTFAQQKEAAALLTSLYRQQPRHPGLAHYIIHAFDSPPLAQYALEAARQYAAIAPAAPHALHMPSHTFTRLGYWDESIKTNRRSADLEPSPASKAHPMDYLVYAYLQQGRDEAARMAIEELGGNTSGDYLAGTLGSYNAVAMPARFALERDDWQSARALKVGAGPPSVLAVTHFARALGAARSADTSSARQEIAKLDSIAAALKAQKESYWAHVVGAQQLAVSAWVAHHEGRHADALRLARDAADAEEKVEKHPVTPGPLIPARELYGDILMLHGKPADALAAYESTLKREPGRLRTLYGAAKAAAAAGEVDAARRFYGEIVKLVDAKSTRPALRDATAFLAQK